MGRLVVTCALVLGTASCSLETGPMPAELAGACFEYEHATSTLTIDVEFEACIQQGCESVVETSCELVQDTRYRSDVDLSASATLNNSGSRGQCGFECEPFVVQCSVVLGDLGDAEYLGVHHGAWQGHIKLDGEDAATCMYYDPGDYS